MEIYKQPGNYIAKYHSILYANGKYYMSLQTSSESRILILECQDIDQMNKGKIIFEKNLDHAVGTNTILLTYDNNLCVIGGDGLERKKSFGFYIYTVPIKDVIESYRMILPINPKESYERPVSVWVDSQPSIIKKEDTYYLYYRLNTKKGIRRLRVTTSKNITEFDNKQYKIIDVKDSVYYGHMFLFEDVFYGFLLTYYTDEIYDNNRVFLVKSNDGFNFEIISMDLFPGKSQIYPVNGIIVINNETYIFFYDFKSRCIKRYNLRNILDNPGLEGSY